MNGSQITIYDLAAQEQSVDNLVGAVDDLLTIIKAKSKDMEAKRLSQVISRGTRSVQAAAAIHTYLHLEPVDHRNLTQESNVKVTTDDLVVNSRLAEKLSSDRLADVISDFLSILLGRETSALIASLNHLKNRARASTSEHRLASFLSLLLLLKKRTTLTDDPNFTSRWFDEHIDDHDHEDVDDEEEDDGGDDDPEPSKMFENILAAIVHYREESLLTDSQAAILKFIIEK